MRACARSLLIGTVLALSTTQALSRAAAGSDLLEALHDADEQRALELVHPDSELDVRDDAGATALMWAAQRSNIPLTRRLLEAGADPNVVDEQGLGPLQIAIDVGAHELAAVLIAHGADVRAKRDSGETVLMSAARTGQIELMRQLIARGADVNAREKRFHQTALMWSAGHPEQVRLLIDSGADIRARTRSWNVTQTIYTPSAEYPGGPWGWEGEYRVRAGGLSALFFAVQSDDVQSVRMLLDAGAGVNDRAADGSTALLLALFKWVQGKYLYLKCSLNNTVGVNFVPNLQIANLLLDRGAQVAVADAAGYTPLHAATVGFLRWMQLNKCQDWVPKSFMANDPAVDAAQGLLLVRRLLELKADPNAVTRYPTPGSLGAVRINPAPVGSTAVHIAAASGNADLMRLLLQHGGDITVLRSDGMSPVAVAAQVNQLAVLQLLAEHGADLKRTYDVSTPIAPANTMNKDDKASAPEPFRSRGKQTLLHLAAVAGAFDLVAFLVEHGVPPDARNDHNETALQLAQAQESARYDSARGVAMLERMLNTPDAFDPDSFKLDRRTSEAIAQLMPAPSAVSRR